MARKPNYEFERRERDRLKAIKVAEKAQAKKEAKNADPAIAEVKSPSRERARLGECRPRHARQTAKCCPND